MNHLNNVKWDFPHNPWDCCIIMFVCMCLFSVNNYSTNTWLLAFFFFFLLLNVFYLVCASYAWVFHLCCFMFASVKSSQLSHSLWPDLVMSERIRQINQKEIAATQRINDPRIPHPDLSGVESEAPIHGKENKWCN